MKLPIKKKYFDAIKYGQKHAEYRDAHITFVCEETGRILRKEIDRVEIFPKSAAPFSKKVREDLFKDKSLIVFYFKLKRGTGG